MNRNILQGNWTQLSGRFRQQRGKVNDEHRKEITAAIVPAGKIQESVGICKIETQVRIKRFEERNKKNDHNACAVRASGDA